VHPAGHVGALLGPGAGLALDDQVPGDAQPPGAEGHDKAGDDQGQAADGRQQQPPLVAQGEQEPDAGAGQDRAITIRNASRDRRVPSAMPITGWVNLCRTACSAGGAFRQMSTSAGTVMTSGQPSGPNQETPTDDTTSSTTTMTDARAAACPMPRLSVTAVVAMGRLSPWAGTSSQAST
jgi:hypothetical protein